MIVSPRYLDRAGFLRLLRTVKERRRCTARRDRFLFYFLGSTGLRISEALSLKVQSLYLDVDPAFARVKTLKRRKLHHDEVLLGTKVARQCKRYLRTTLPRVLRRSVLADGDDALFPAGPRRGLRHYHAAAPMTRSNASKLFRYYAERAGLGKNVTLHSLRHYRGTVLYQTTRDLRFTQQQLRHSSISSTERYLHISPERARRYLDDLEKKPQT